MADLARVVKCKHMVQEFLLKILEFLIYLLIRKSNLTICSMPFVYMLDIPLTDDDRLSDKARYSEHPSITDYHERLSRERGISAPIESLTLKFPLLTHRP